MSPRMEKAIHFPSGLHAGSSGPDETAGNMCRSSRSEWPYRFGRALATTTNVSRPATTPTTAAGFMKVIFQFLFGRLAELADGASDRSEVGYRQLFVFARHDDAVC